MDTLRSYIPGAVRSLGTVLRGPWHCPALPFAEAALQPGNDGVQFGESQRLTRRAALPIEALHKQLRGPEFLNRNKGMVCKVKV